MSLEPIYSQKVLSPIYTQKYLPPIEADSSQIKESIEQKYNKSVALPNIHKEVVQQNIASQGIVLQESNNTQNSQKIEQQQSNIIISKPVMSQSMNYKYNLYLNNINNQPVNPQLNISQKSNNKSVIYRTPFAAYNPAKVNPTI